MRQSRKSSFFCGLVASLADCCYRYSTVNKSPLFVKLAIAALAIVTDDKAIMQTVRRNNTSDSETKYAPDIVRLTMLQHLSKVRNARRCTLRRS